MSKTASVRIFTVAIAAVTVWALAASLREARACGGGRSSAGAPSHEHVAAAHAEPRRDPGAGHDSSHGAAGASAQSGEAGAAAVAVQTVEIAVTREGFVPAEVRIVAGRPVKLVVTRKTDVTCATSIVIRDFGIEKELPLDLPVEVTFTPSASGRIRYACAMDMLAGVLVVE